jgi:hypothetical protein
MCLCVYVCAHVCLWKGFGGCTRTCVEAWVHGRLFPFAPWGSSCRKCSVWIDSQVYMFGLRLISLGH